jgi:hypothetical protein
MAPWPGIVATVLGVALFGGITLVAVARFAVSPIIRESLQND